MRHHPPCLFLLTLGLWTSPCLGQTAPGPASAPFTEFGIRLLGALAARASQPNVFLSPTSAGIAFTAVLNGAAGETRRQLVAALGYDPDAARDIDPLSGTRGDSGVTVRSATSLWVDERLPLRQRFAERNRSLLDAGVAAVDFRFPATASRINAWAAMATSGKIPEVVTFPFQDDLRLLITSAVYFKGSWADAFDNTATRPDSFRIADGGKVIVPFMGRGGTYAYWAGDWGAAVRMPYRGDRYSALILLPAAGSAPEPLLGILSGGGLEDLRKQLVMTQLNIALPRFTIGGGYDLIPAMRSLGVSDLFDARGAELPRIANAPLYVGSATQQTFLEVNEEGTEAAAVTSVLLMPRDGAMTPPSFIVNRPFLLAIQDDRTGALLFLGRIGDPRTP